MRKNFFLLSISLILIGLPIRVNAKSESLYNTLKNNATKDNIASTYVTNSTGIDFSEVSSDTNGKGLYMVNSTSNSTYPILYYRGNITNNNVLYAGFCWQIIRTTDTGGTKLMYAGVPNDDKCNNTKENLAIGKTTYNPDNKDPYYGWMYNTSEGDVNTTDSIAKTYLDNWFENNMLDYVKELEDTVWCNDRSLDENNVFYTRTRLESGKPTLECSNKDDSFTVFSENGNKKLTYPTAIINADELTYAGEVLKKTQVDTFVNISYSYWSMTPYVHNKNMYPNSKGMLNMNTFTYSASIRPMVSVRNSAIIMSGNGSKESPYIIRVTKKHRVYKDDYTTSDVDEAADKEIVNINNIDRPGYKFISYKITDLDNNELNISINNNKFKMPNEDVKISSIYREVKEFHNVTSNNENINITNESVEEEQIASFKINLPRGFKITKLTLKNSSDTELDINIEEKDGEYTFEMPNEDVIVDVELEELNKYAVTGDVDNLNYDLYYVGEIVEFKVRNKEKYSISKVYLTDEEENILDIEIINNNGSYSFTMPDNKISINVEYVENKEENNPNTADNILNNINILILCISGLIISKKIH